MKKKNILIMTSMDTKEQAVKFLADCIKDRGHNAITMDLSLLKEPKMKPDITSVDVAKAGGGSKADTIGETGERWKRIDIMVRGSSKIISDMISRGKIDGVMSIGGATMTGLSSRTFQSLPYGVPKLIISSVAGMPSYNFIGCSDIALLASIVDTEVFSAILKNTLIRAAGMICGSLENNAKPISVELNNITKIGGKRVIAMTELGYISTCVGDIMDIIGKKGNYEVMTFHGQGIGDTIMENLVDSGVKFDVILDLAIAGLTDYILGGNRAATVTRLEAAGKQGIPQIISPTGIDFISCGPISRKDRNDPLWANRNLADRKMWVLDEQRVLAKISAEEAVETATVIANKLNKSKAPVKFLVPWDGWEVTNRKGGVLYDPEIDHLLIDTMKKIADPDIVEFREYPELYLNTLEFASIIVNTMEEMLGK